MADDMKAAIGSATSRGAVLGARFLKMCPGGLSSGVL